MRKYKQVTVCYFCHYDKSRCCVTIFALKIQNGQLTTQLDYRVFALDYSLKIDKSGLEFKQSNVRKGRLYKSIIRAL